MAYWASAMTWSRPERTCLFQDLGSEIPGGLCADIVISEVLYRSAMETTITSNESPSCFEKLGAQKSLDQYRILAKFSDPARRGTDAKVPQERRW